MDGRKTDDGAAEHADALTAEDADHAKTLMINAKLRLVADMLQDLAYDLAGSERAEVIADLIQMSVKLHRLQEQRDPELCENRALSDLQS